MTRRQHRLGATVTVAIVAALARAAYGDPAPDLTHYVHLQSGSHVTTDGGTKLDLPPGYFFDEPTYDKLNTTMKSLQDDSTRYKAENAALKVDLEKWQPGWLTLAGAFVGGCALGWYLHDKL